MNYKNVLLVFVFSTIIIFTSCERYYNPGLDIGVVQEDSIKVPENEALIQYINNSGDYINSKAVPNLVSAENVFKNLSTYYIIDIRNHEAYVAGHIKGSVNVKYPEILPYLEKNISPIVYDKIVFVCYSGESASYVTSILRIMGYSNAFAMKYGMSAWNKSLDKWSKNISNKYANKLDTISYPKAQKTAYPNIKTGGHCGAEILQARAQTVLNTPFSKLRINADRAFTDTSFYIINYWPIDKYKKGHIPQAINYAPKNSLNDTAFLKTLPVDKKILVYSFTGHHSAFVIAYLRILGYNAFTLEYGVNGFMHSTISSRENWQGFKAANEINNYPLIKGEYPTEEKVNVAPANNTGEKTDTLTNKTDSITKKI